MNAAAALLALLPPDPAPADEAAGLPVLPGPPAPAPPPAGRRARRRRRARARRLVGASAGCLLVGLVAAGWAAAAADQGHQIARGTPAPPPGLDVVVAAPVPSEVLLRGGTVRVVPLGGSPPYRVDLFVDGDWVGADAAAPFLVEAGRHGRGPHDVKAKVTDAAGVVRYSGAVPVTVERLGPLARAGR